VYTVIAFVLESDSLTTAMPNSDELDFSGVYSINQSINQSEED